MIGKQLQQSLGAVILASLGTLLEDLLLEILGDDSDNRGTIDPNG